MKKPEKLYHGSNIKTEGALFPIMLHTTDDHRHVDAAVFATERKDIASLFMLSPDILSSIGFEQDIAYICIWGTLKEYLAHDTKGYLYILPTESFRKVGKEYEWQSYDPVVPAEVITFSSVIQGMMECGAQVYFINNNDDFDYIVENKNNRSDLLCTRISENERLNIHFKKFI